MFAVQTNSSRSGAGEGARVWVTSDRLDGWFTDDSRS